MKIVTAARLVGLFCCFIGSASAVPKVAVTIAPVHSLVTALMQGVATADLILDAGQSPHDASLAPSAVRKLLAADLVVWVGPNLEVVVNRVMNQLPESRILTLLDLPTVEKLAVRQGGVWQQSHKHDADHSHNLVESDTDGDSDNVYQNIDAHIWLSTRNAAAIVTAVLGWLEDNDPVNAVAYKANAEQLYTRISKTRQDTAASIEPWIDYSYLVFHDAYQYFEHEFKISPQGAVSFDPSKIPGARRLQALRGHIESTGVECIFSEPQFRSGAVETLAEGFDIRIATLDPMGSELATGPDHWFQLQGNLARDLVTCLSGEKSNQ